MTASVILEVIMVLELTPAELRDLMATEEVDVVDVREPSEWVTGHIARSRLVPLERFRADPDAALVRGTVIVFVCAKGVRSMAAAKLAERHGYDRVFNLAGGTKAWAAAGLPLADESRAAA
jgi:rhodanese-related sulfurtransferase